MNKDPRYECWIWELASSMMFYLLGEGGLSIYIYTYMMSGDEWTSFYHESQI